MSDQVSQNRYKQPQLRHYSDQNVLIQTPSPFNRRCYYPDPSINGHGEHLHLHYHQPLNNSAKPPPTTNLRFVMCDRGGAKAYFRFHGGIGDGCGGVGCRTTVENTAAPPLKLFEALTPAHFQIDVIKKACEGGFVNPATVKWVPPVELSAGTGVFLPAYPKRTGRTKAGNRKNNGGMSASSGGGGGYRGRRRRRQAKQDEDKCFEQQEDGKQFDEIPIELLLPPEWTY